MQAPEHWKYRQHENVAKYFLLMDLFWDSSPVQAKLLLQTVSEDGKSKIKPEDGGHAQDFNQ